MLIQTLSAPLTKALALNSQAIQFSTSIFVSPTDPSGDGVFDGGGRDGGTSPNQLILFPFAQGEPGGEFWMNLWGWWRCGSDAYAMVWIPTLLAQLSVVVGTYQGFAGRLLGPTEYLASAIGITGGTGYSNNPGNGTVCYATVPLQGCQKFQFDFMIGEEVPAFPNCFWAVG